MTACLFCKIAAGIIKSDIVFEDDKVLAFKDINPQAPVHVLVIPKQHIATLNDLENSELAAHLMQSVVYIAKQQGLADDGYRVNINCNKNGGQDVYHLHLHLLGGRQMTWPPG